MLIGAPTWRNIDPLPILTHTDEIDLDQSAELTQERESDDDVVANGILRKR